MATMKFDRTIFNRAPYKVWQRWMRMKGITVSDVCLRDAVAKALAEGLPVAKVAEKCGASKNSVYRQINKDKK